MKLKDIGEFKSAPQVIEDIINENTAALDDHLSQGWDIEQEVEIDESESLSPLDCALIMNCFKSVQWLVEHDVNLNVKGNPGFLKAARYCDETVMKYIVEHGARVNERDDVGSDAFEQAIYGKRYENLPVIHSLGHTVDKYGGNAFRNAISDRNYRVIKFFIDNGVDVNYNSADMVYPFKPTPLCVAARYVDLPMCKYLVEHGADVTLSEKDGTRPYSIALEKGDDEMAEYFKSLEPVEYHDIQNKLDELKPFKLSKELKDFLQGDELHFDLDESDVGFIDFFSLTEAVPMKIGRQKLLRISKSTGDYDHIQIVWRPKTKKIAYYDVEHEELQDICGFEDFIADISTWMQKIIDGDL